MTRLHSDFWTAEDCWAAARQGWMLSDCGHDRYEIQRYDEACEASEQYGFEVPQLEDDLEAAKAFKAALERGEPHALKAFEFLREHFPQELRLWGIIS